MKKCIAMMLVLLFTLTACGNVNDDVQPIKEGSDVNPSQSNDRVQENTDKLYYGQYQMSNAGFSEQVKNNAIDAAYKAELTKLQESPDFNTQSWVELEDKYVKLWDNELNNTYGRLLKKLNEKEQKELQEAQKGWLQYHTHESKFVAEAWDAFGLGSQGRVQAVMAVKNRIRERTLQLMEYDYMLGGEVEFLYQGQ